MLAAWLEVPGLPETLDWFSAVAGVDLRAHGTTSDADTIRDTAVAQPLILATGRCLALAAQIDGHNRVSLAGKLFHRAAGFAVTQLSLVMEVQVCIVVGG